eukprot:COSAG02_NODE_276_length_26189_cov_810.678191_2_plen_163_part_00
MPREPQPPRNPNLKKKNCRCLIESPHAAPAASPPRYPLQGKKNCRCLPSHSAYTNTILLYSTRSVSTHGVGNCLVEINLPTLPLSCSRLESRRVNRSRSMVIRSSLPAYLSNILFDLYTLYLLCILYNSCTTLRTNKTLPRNSYGKVFEDLLLVYWNSVLFV